MTDDIYEECHDKGGMSYYAYDDDPKRIAFTAARYKHTAKMLMGYNNVLEIGCADGLYSRIVRQHVNRLTAIDTDQKSIDEAIKNNLDKWPIDFKYGDISSELANRYDAVYLLDVLEHIEAGGPEHDFLSRIHSLAPVCVIGMPSIESQPYASKLSREGHVNCKSGNELKSLLDQYYSHVFVFTMHDETLGTSFFPMSQYLLALCVG